MDLREYLFFEDITQKDFADKIGVCREYMNVLVKRKGRPSRKLAQLIEKETNGKVCADVLLVTPLKV